MDFTVISNNPRIDRKQEIVQVLVQENDNEERLFIMTISFGEVEHLLSDVDDPLTIVEAFEMEDNSGKSILCEFIQTSIDNEKLERDCYELAPYYEPKQVKLGRHTIDAKDIIKEEGCGFVSSEDYDYLIY